MKCFRHPSIDAIGICRACAKGVCTKCVVDLGTAIACKDSCETAVKSLRLISPRDGAIAIGLVSGISSILFLVDGLTQPGLAGLLSSAVGMSLAGLSAAQGRSLWLLSRTASKPAIAQKQPGETRIVIEHKPIVEKDELDHRFEQLEREFKNKGTSN